jgi:CubicO group peptidase (beta-lactamase class C family)
MKIFASLLGTVLVAELGISNFKGDHVDDVIIAQMRERHIPGVALAVIQESRVIRDQGYGLADEEKKVPVTSSTLFQAASVSKPVAALGALHLVEQGKLSLDENVNARLGRWKVPENRFTKNHPVTLRLILSHSAGLTVHGFSGYPVGGPIPSLVRILDGRPPANSAPIRVKRIPGSRWSYSGGGFVVMQQMMIDVTGKSFADYMEETVLKPLGMSSSTFKQPLPEAWEDHAATGYTDAPRRPVDGRWRVHPELAAAGLWTTAGDLAQFLIGVQHSLAGISNPVISQSMTHQMLTKQNGDSGLGFMVGGAPVRFGHNGDNVGFNAVTIAFETGEGVVILMNANTDIEVLKNILVEAVGEQYHWPGYPLPRPLPNQSMKPTAPLRNKFSQLTTTPCRGLSLSR